jgi:hypothetical protein
VIPALAWSSTPTGGQTGNTKDGLSASDVTASTRLIVRRVESEPNRIYLYDPEAEETHVVLISEKTRLSARRKKDFDGRRKLDFGDLAMGQTLKITYRLDDGRITSIQVVEKAS